MVNALFHKYALCGSGGAGGGNTLIQAGALLGLNKCVVFNSRLSMWVNSPGVEKTVWVFTNQALNTMFNYGSSSAMGLFQSWFYPVHRNRPSGQTRSQTGGTTVVSLADARDVTQDCDLWITDPPYADAINYHELSELFLAWDKTLLAKAFPHWYTDSKRTQAIGGNFVSGGGSFARSMTDIYTNLANHTSSNGLQNRSSITVLAFTALLRTM
ncbi:hypothetical protein FACS1894151_09740 [Spirochaetia bacterium]|nr:hypothetical protein FACS1894151_09740 [Spirochaetia bacterium]